MSTYNSCLQDEDERLTERKKEEKKKGGKWRGQEMERSLVKVRKSQLSSFSASPFLSSSAWGAVWIESNNLDWLSLDEWLSNDTQDSASASRYPSVHISDTVIGGADVKVVVQLFGVCARTKCCRSLLSSLKVPFDSCWILLWSECLSGRRTQWVSVRK